MDRRTFLGLIGGLGGSLAGCFGQGSPPQPTDSPSPTATATDVPETPPHPDCETPTPQEETVSDVSWGNERDATVTLSVTVNRKSDGAIVLDETVTLAPGERGGRDDVFADEGGTYRVSAAVDGESVVETFDIAAEADRRSILVVDVAETVTVSRLHYHPTPTATPCPQ